MILLRWQGNNDYYPFGLDMPGRSGGDYRYGFNGKEKDKDREFGSLTHYDYGFRIYNPGVGRFLSVDPLVKDYPWYSPYQFAGNTPIWAVDLEGLEPTLPPYRWDSSSGYKSYGDYYNTGGSSGLMRVQNYWVVWQYANQEGDIIHKYWNPDIERWKEFEPAKPSCLSCELSTLGHIAVQEAIDIGIPTLKIAAGIVAVAAALPTGGASLTGLGALGISFGVVAGTYTTVTGGAELVLNITNRKELKEKIPSGYLNAVIGLTITYMVDDKEVTETINGLLTVVEGVATYNFDDPTALQKLDNAINISNVIISNIEREQKQETSDDEE